MPSVGHVLSILEAISTKDWDEVAALTDGIAKAERKKKHFQSANKLYEAAEVIRNHLAGDEIATVASPVGFPEGPIPELLVRDDSSDVENVILPVANQNELTEFLAEWAQERQLKEHGMRPRSTVLLHGPPGCGKTALARKIAKDLQMPMYLVRFDSLISSYLGETGSNLRKVFSFASSNRCILFIDEIDAIAKLRDDRSELGELKRVVISLLQNIDLSNSKSLIIAATNHPHMLDIALWRRFEIVWELNPPEKDIRLKILDRDIRSRLSKESISVFERCSEGFSGADIKRVETASKRRMFIAGLTADEAVLLSMIEQLRRNSENKPADQIESFLTEAAKGLRLINEKNYSFKELERLSGISHSTLHHRMSL